MATQTYTLEEWQAEARKRFGDDSRKWKFVCPSCGHVAAVEDWEKAGATAQHAAFSCVGRWMKESKTLFEKPGPCNYAGGGLFRLNPVTVTTDDGKKHDMFAFAEPQPPTGEK